MTTELPTIELHGFQAGADGFVKYGLGLDGPPIDYLFIRALAGRQSGKTFGGGCRSTFYMGSYANSYGMIVSLTSDKLRDTILPTLYTIYRQLGLQYGVDYTYNKTERCITFTANNAICYLRSAEEPDNLPGPSLAWFWLDEFRMMQERVFLLLQPTLTQPGFPHQAWLTSTPAGKGHWSRKIWLPQTYALDYGTKPLQHKAGTYVSFKGRTGDNPHLASAYYQTLEDTYGKDTQLYKQELLGEEVTMEGLVYDCFSPEKHLLPSSQWPTKPKIVLAGVDFGFRTPSAIIVGGVDQEGRHYLIDEFYRSGLDEKALCREAKRLMKQYNIRFFLCVTGNTEILTLHGPKPITHIHTGDLLPTRSGLKPVLARFTIPDQPVYRITLEDDTTLDATSDHPLWVDNIGWCTVSLIQQMLQHREVHLLCLPSQRRQSFITEQESFGNITTDPFHQDIIFTTGTQIPRTMTSLISNVSQRMNIANTIMDFGLLDTIKREKHGIPTPVEDVVRPFLLREPGTTVLQHAGTITTVQTISPQKPEYASNAVLSSDAEKIARRDLVPVRVLTVSLLPNVATVYDLRVAGEFIANNILSHNCDYEDPRYIKAFRTSGLPAITAKKVIGSRSDPSSGIGLCYSLLNGKMRDGTPQIYIDPKLVNFRREIDNYALESEKFNKNPSERPIPTNNHAMDAWRYLEAALNYYYVDTQGFGNVKASLKYT